MKSMPEMRLSGLRGEIDGGDEGDGLQLRSCPPSRLVENKWSKGYAVFLMVYSPPVEKGWFLCILNGTSGEFG